MRKIPVYGCLFLCALATSSNAQKRVGIGTTSPKALLHVLDSAVLFSATNTTTPPNLSPLPVSGAGVRFMWVPEKAAFRVGEVSTDEWDQAKIGYYSIAAGSNPVASGDHSIALGQSSNASASYAVALGGSSVASGTNSFASGGGSASQDHAVSLGGFANSAYAFAGPTGQAQGNRSFASGDGIAASSYSFAFGQSASAGGVNAVAIGSASNASGNSSFAAAAGTASNAYAVGLASGVASGLRSVAIGETATANSSYSVAIGTDISTNTHPGSFIFGDNSAAGNLNCVYDNEMVMRFAGGYRFFTNAGTSIGVSLAANDNSWNTMSDYRKKENFLPVNGEEVLNRIAGFHLSTWNYKGQDLRSYRHYGPMAQEFHQAFGNDALGTMGNDTTINQADFDGVNFVAIQALEKRTKELMRQTEELRSQLNQQAALQQANEKLSVELAENRQLTFLLQQKLEKLEAALTQSGEASLRK